ncbi:hypothetical protein ACFLTP_05555 [Chloroflexota bacterium]
MIRRNKLLTLFLLYGFVVGFISVWWWNFSDSLFLPNVPGMLIGDKAYSLSIEIFGNPSSSQAHYSIPWILRVPQIYVPITFFFWGLLGLIVQLCRNLIRGLSSHAERKKEQP